MLYYVSEQMRLMNDNTVLCRAKQESHNITQNNLRLKKFIDLSSRKGFIAVKDKLYTTSIHLKIQCNSIQFTVFIQC